MRRMHALERTQSNMIKFYGKRVLSLSNTNVSEDDAVETMYDYVSMD